MTRSFRSPPAFVVAAAVLAAVAACGAPSPPAATPSTASASATTSGPVTLYTLEKPEHRNPGA